MWFSKFFKKAKEVVSKPNVGKLCDCYGEIRTNGDKLYEWVGLGNGQHTAFMAGQCKKCGGISAFPSYNLKLAINEGTSETKQIIAKKLGYKFDVEKC